MYKNKNKKPLQLISFLRLKTELFPPKMRKEAGRSPITTPIQQWSETLSQCNKAEKNNKRHTDIAKITIYKFKSNTEETEEQKTQKKQNEKEGG